MNVCLLEVSVKTFFSYSMEGKWKNDSYIHVINKNMIAELYF